MVTLTIDTTADCGGAAIFRDEVCLASATRGSAADYAVGLFEIVEDALKKAAIPLSEIESFVAASGPGSFTGIRVGLAAVQGWADAFGRPATGVSVLDAIAESTEAPLTLSLLDARRGECYARLFRRVKGEASLIPLSDGVILKPAGIVPFIKTEANFQDCCIGVRGGDDETLARVRDVAPNTVRIVAQSELFAAMDRLSRHTSGQPRRFAPDLSACYIRRPDAEMNCKP